MTIDEDLRWLVEHADEELRDPSLPTDPVRAAAFLRHKHAANRSRLLAELRDLRRRGKSKFTTAERMFFTRIALEQATDELLATYKAARFSPAYHVADLCCGVGGDTIALARRGPVTAIDKDASVAFLAAANLRALGLENVATVRCADVRDVVLSSFDAWHLDPHRREGGRRRSSPAKCEPPLDEFLRRPDLLPRGAIKLSPAAEVRELQTGGVELEWLGHSRQCQQLVAWFGSLARHPGKRVATWLSRDETGTDSVSTIAEDDAGPAPVTRALPRFLYEPQPVVLAADLEDTLAARHGLQRIAPGIAYFVSDQRLVNEPLLRGFEILAALPFRPQRLRKRLGELNASVVEVKKRGVDIDPQRLQRDLASPGDIPLTVILTTIGKSVRALIASRLCDT